MVRFWRGARAEWFRQAPAFDRRFRARFLDAYRAARRGACDGWAATADGLLALVILLDQFPRHAFRGTAAMYETDPQARRIARAGLSAGSWEAVPADLRLFLCLPFAHSEDLADQDLSVRLNARLGPPWLAHAQGHRDIVRRFGRFPHRNALLGRPTTREEQDFLDHGGFAG